MMNLVGKVGGLAVGIALLVLAFENCGGMGQISGGRASTPLSSTTSAAGDTDNSSTTSAGSTNKSDSAMGVSCTTYYTPGDLSTIHNSQDAAGRVTFDEVDPGTTVVQSLGCNGRDLQTGYQDSYCRTPGAGCRSCLKPAATYTCDSDGTWYARKANAGTNDNLPINFSSESGELIRSFVIAASDFSSAKLRLINPTSGRSAQVTLTKDPDSGAILGVTVTGVPFMCHDPKAPPCQQGFVNLTSGSTEPNCGSAIYFQGAVSGSISDITTNAWVYYGCK